MAHRMEKNRLRHGWRTTMVGSGEKATYTTARPSCPAQHSPHVHGRTRPAYAAVRKVLGR